MQSEESSPAHAAAEKPLVRARRDFAAALQRIRHECWLREQEACSNVAVARACGIDEKTVRLWGLDRSAEPGIHGKPMPVGALELLPTPLFDGVIEYLTAKRSKRPGRGRRALLRLREAMADLEREIAHEDRDEVVRALVGVQATAGELLKKAVG